KSNGAVLSSRSPVQAASSASNDNLEFRILSVKCVDRTSDGFLGTEASDEIRLGGISIDESGDTHKISDFSVMTFDKDGEKKTYDPKKQFTYFNLNEGTDYPKTYYVILV